nr:photosystem I assembly protein Ycf4 [Pedinophyceae sp. YPF-701]
MSEQEAQVNKKKMETSSFQPSDIIRRDNVVGSRRLSNYFWGIISLIGGLGFLLTGFSSYFQRNLLPLIHAENISFFPQGFVMCFYGSLGFLFSTYLWLTILWSVGGGFNEFNKKEKKVRIFRWGFPGKNRKIDILYNFNDIEAIRVDIQEGLNPRRTIYLCVKGKKAIPLTRVGQPLTLEEVETQAAQLAKFLQVSLEGLT